MAIHDFATRTRYSRGAVVRQAALAAGALALVGGRPGRVLAAGKSAQSGNAAGRNNMAHDALLAANLGLGFRLGGALAKQLPAENLFFSPLSVSVALAMAYNGASGPTLAAMSTTLGLHGLTKQDVNLGNRALIDGLRGRDAAVKVSIADSIWLDQTLRIAPGFGETLRSYYGAGLRSLDFRDPGTPTAINTWVKQQTHGLIPSIVKTIDTATVMYLINALYFKAAWSAQFPAYATKPGPFTTGDGRQKTVPMMSVSDNFDYVRTDVLQAIRLPYASGQFSMYIVLPAAGASVRDFVSTLTPARWNALLGSLRMGHGAVRMPRFSVDFSSSLKPALSALGMATAFDPNTATFTAMIKERNAYITDIQHRAIMNVDEQGTLAAAVTSIGIGVTAIQVDSFTMDVNRPFFCAIRDDTSGSMLFMGAIVNPG